MSAEPSTADVIELEQPLRAIGTVTIKIEHSSDRESNRFVYHYGVRLGDATDVDVDPVALLVGLDNFVFNMLREEPLLLRMAASRIPEVTEEAGRAAFADLDSELRPRVLAAMNAFVAKHEGTEPTPREGAA
jgi:hypothetical protein